MSGERLSFTVSFAVYFVGLVGCNYHDVSSCVAGRLADFFRTVGAVARLLSVVERVDGRKRGDA